MKKKNRRYRIIKNVQEIKYSNIKKQVIDKEVDGIKTSYLSMSHIITYNPIRYENNETKLIYLKKLSTYLKIGGWSKRKYESSMFKAYEKIILDTNEVRTNHGIKYYKNIIVFDLIHILGYELTEKNKAKLKKVEKKYLEDFVFDSLDKNLFLRIINSTKSTKGVKNIQKVFLLDDEVKYCEKIIENLSFRDKYPFRVMVTATMSAGKSTFINSLVGKYICLSQNMACTSKVHSIINKSFEDGFSYEYDYDLVLTAGKEELLNDNELNNSDKIYVSTHYNGGLSSGRYIINDSPGVNFNGDSKHKEITERLIKGRKYNLLIYIMNSTQLATNDEDEHLDFIKQNIGRTPIIFVMNKVDSYNVEEENIFETIQRQIDYLTKKGFKNPIICPISSRAGYLAKQCQNGIITRSEKRELYNYIDKFEQMNLVKYYKDIFPKINIDDSDKEEFQLLKNCGLSYVEEIIRWYKEGGNKNGTSKY
ncbi:MAG: hypothetical protein HFF36_10310 [Coprobacillus sp.]|jgi:GTPase Era involved in 16S rRNA processing|uniref:dynamin family protein n=1 Tax=Thomasclavelia cocleata TaxID=69824 RepID=UPI00216F1970|nr:dynamin family protein [Thomasclavelia cocleata]MCI9094157.1 hypothetical protein [Coprobacillus sp.]